MPIHLPPISRRRFLAGAASVVGAGLCLPQLLEAGQSSSDADEFLLLSDIHIGERRDEVRHGIKSAETFQRAVEDILKLPHRPAHAIVSGDCAMHHGRPGDYGLLGELLKPLREDGMTIHMALGNHDNRENFLKAFPEAKTAAEIGSQVPDKCISVLETKHANWFLLDSLDKTASTPGLLGEAQMEWLGKALDARPDKPALVIAHHHLDPVLKFKSLADSRAFLKLVMKRKQVKAYIFGHTHIWGVAQPMGIGLINVPTTAWTFEKTGEQPRGFVTAQLNADGAAFKLHSLDPKHPKHGEKIELKWRV